MTSRSAPGLTWINTAEESAVRAALRELCAAPGWAERLLAQRPYPDTATLCAAGVTATAHLTDPELRQAMAAHPPIGRPTPDDLTSAREQRGMAGASPELAAELHTLNQAYQDRFGHVFLICASGLTSAQLRDALRARIGHPPEREWHTTRTELGKINRIRLTRLAEQGAPR